MTKKIVFVWENFGPGHADRCGAVADISGSRWEVVGIELSGKSGTYDWESEKRDNFKKITLFPGTVLETVGVWRRFRATLSACMKHSADAYFLCHYERAETLLLAWSLRLLGRTVFVMNDSKYDDYKRFIYKEVLKWFYYLPYQGGLASGNRSSDYMRFLGVPENRIAKNYNALSANRIRAYVNDVQALNFEEKPFVIVARLVPKKNLFVALSAYAEYVSMVKQQEAMHVRRLKILGNGPLERDLKLHAEAIGVSDMIDWYGFVQTADVCKTMVNAIALLLISTEEQFGNVVIEAAVLGVPSIVSTNVGARDDLVKTAVSGFIVEPENVAGLAYFMHHVGSDSLLWARLSAAARKIVVDHGDSVQFAEAVESLVDR